MESFRNTEQPKSAQKKAIRASLATLPDPTPAERAGVIDVVSAWLSTRSPRGVVGFLAMGSEIDMEPLVDRHPDIQFGLTRTAPGVQLTVHPFDARRELHPFGFQQPAEGSPHLADFEIVLVPGMGFGWDGTRLGRGAGYYDRFLQSRDVEKIGMTTSSRILTGIPREPHDVLMDWIATESEIRPRMGR